MLFDGALKAGDSLTVWGPVGDFVLADSDRPLVFVACDTGFAPIKSLLEHAMAVDAVESLSLDWLATRPDGHYLANQCRAWAAAFDHFRYAAHVDPDPANGAWRMADAMAAALPLAGSDVYVAGPAPFVAAITAALHAAGVPAPRLRSLVL
jgi:ferredoxin-NADP reductase